MAVGAGTVLDMETARRCLDAGATFLTSTGLVPEVVEFALKNDVVVFPGAMTPTDVIAAWKTGADFVKIFPCGPLGGPSYIRALKLPFPQVPLIATGGVNQRTAGNFILAGATALGIGSELINPEGLPVMKEEQIQELARRYLNPRAPTARWSPVGQRRTSSPRCRTRYPRAPRCTSAARSTTVRALTSPRPCSPVRPRKCGPTARSCSARSPSSTRSAPTT